MDYITTTLGNLLQQTAFLNLTVGNLLMIGVACVFLYLAIKKGFEPLLLVPIAFGMLLVNIYPDIMLIFMGVGAMTDFGPLIANPKSFLLGAAAQFGIYAAYFLAIFFGFNDKAAAAISIIGGADGPTSIFLAGKLGQTNLMGPIAVAAYSYMALVPIIQPPIMKFFTTEEERKIKMEQLRPVSKLERILFPIIVTIVVCMILPSTAPLVGMLMLGNLFKESGVVGQLAETASNAMMYIVVILLGTSVGATTSAEAFLNVDTIKIVALGLVAFAVGTAAGVLFGKLMCKLTGGKVNPLIGSAGVSAVPMAARVSQKVGSEAFTHIDKEKYMNTTYLKNFDFEEIHRQAPEEEASRQRYYMEWARKMMEARFQALFESGEAEAIYGAEKAQSMKEAGILGTFCVTTFGCQMNARDSEKLCAVLEAIGFEATEEEQADFVLYNTCTVRENANLRVYGRLGYLNTMKKKNPNMFVALCGCMMQEPQVVEKIRKSYRFVDIIFGTHNIFKLAELICRRLQEQKMVVDVWEGTDRIEEELPSDRKYAFKSGVVEVMLLGQNVNSYGKNLEQPVTFAQLLRMVNDIEGLERIRFMTSHPKDLSDELIEAMKDCKKVCNHLHLPLQSGSTEVLKVMNRRYTKEQYLTLVDKIRAAVPDISLTTDIIVGFPGETEEDFQETMDVVRKVRFDSAFTFIYSKRSGTPAAKMENQVPEDVVKDRFDRLLAEVQKISTEVCGRDVHTTQKVLVEEVDSHEKGWLTGRLENNTVVHFPGDKALIGKIVDVYLEESRGFYYMGQI